MRGLAEPLSWLWFAAGIAIGAALLSFVLILWLRPLLARYALARPNARSSHKAPTPQGGGVAVIAATLCVAAAGAVIAAAQTSTLFDLGTVAAATILVTIVGAADDIRTLAVGPRLLSQALAVGAVIALMPPDTTALPFLPWWLERALLLVGGVWFLNLVNFMDGIDWMTVAEVIPVTFGLIVLGTLGLLPAHATIVALALFGAMLGFAPFNRPVARLFMGDVGSLPIGLLLGWLLLLLAGRGHLAAALLLPLYYLADTTITLLRRVIRGEQFWQAHRRHFYQRAADSGVSVPSIVGRVFVVNLALVMLALISARFDTRLVDVVTLTAGTGLVALLLFSFGRGR
jgi:UDP-N-acetylmuramyl pentapeptide phosphotransferase/UDP-N-acetylglucosamine-1-phosphate transferase